MFITAVFILFLIKLRWPKNKSIYEQAIHDSRALPFCAYDVVKAERLWGRKCEQASRSYSARTQVNGFSPFSYPEPPWILKLSNRWPKARRLWGRGWVFPEVYAEVRMLKMEVVRNGFFDRKFLEI